MIKEWMYKRIFNVLVILLFLSAVSWACYSYISAKSEVKTFDAAIAIVSNLLSEKSPILALESVFNNLFNLAILQVFTFLVLTTCLIFLVWFLFRIYSIEKRNGLLDSLTEIYNRKSIMLGLKHELVRARNFHHRLSVAIIDIDHFRKYNSINGSLEGDRVLKKVVQIIEKEIRSTDSVGRIGGEEFLIIFPETSKQTAFDICEKIRKDIQCLDVTVSIGVSEFDLALHSRRKESIILDVDKRLYLAKLAGRNKVR
jgi:diguanylate cyclase (GGDEF)-like protein